MTVTVRDLTEADIPAALAVLATEWPDAKDQKMAEAEMRAGLTPDRPGFYTMKFVVAELDGEIVGTGAWGEDPYSSNIYGLSWGSVTPAHQHKGIAMAMLDYRLAKIQAYNGNEAYNVLTRTWDNPAWRERGFVAGFKDVIKSEQGKSILVAHFGAA